MMKKYSLLASNSLGLVIGSIGAGYIYGFTGSYQLNLYKWILMFIIDIVAVLIVFKGKEELEEARL